MTRKAMEVEGLLCESFQDLRQRIESGMFAALQLLDSSCVIVHTGVLVSFDVSQIGKSNRVVFIDDRVIRTSEEASDERKENECELDPSGQRKSKTTHKNVGSIPSVYFE